MSLKKVSNMKEKIPSTLSIFSSGSSMLGSYNLCHSICMGVIALLSLIGITIVGMPFAFFQTIAVPAWSIAIALFGFSLFMYLSRKCVSKNLLTINAGMLLVGIPFEFSLKTITLTLGVFLIVFSIYSFGNEKLYNKKKRSCCHGPSKTK